MKKYKNIFPLVLIFLMLISTYLMVSNSAQEAGEYNDCLKNAREYAKQGIIVDALEFYDNALKMNNSLDVCVEKGKLYLDNNMMSEAIEWGEDIVNKYPKEPDAYDYLLTSYYTSEDYKECFRLFEKADKLNISSDTIKKIFNKLEYSYNLGFRAYDDVSCFSGGFCAVKKEELWGYVDNSGNEKIKNKYKTAGAFFEDTAFVVSDNDDVCYIDTKGNKKKNIPQELNCKFAGMIINNCVALYDGSKYAFFDSDFNKLFGDYDDAVSVNYGFGFVKSGSKWTMIDETGNTIGSNSFDDVVIDEKIIAFRNDRAFVKKDGSYALIDSSGNLVGDNRFEDVCVFLGEGFAAVKSNGKWGFVDKNGNFKIEPEYENARSFSNGLAAVCKDEKWGYIDDTGKLVIDFQFEECKDINEQGVAFVKTNKEWITLTLYSKNYK